VSDSSEVLSASTRQQFIDAALIAIRKATRDHAILSLTVESQNLANGHPDSGMAPDDIRELVATLTVNSGVSIAFD
jgi:2-phospho-L-lactate guanylyltransferase (CobY/MobA/RfbA family)